MLTVYVHERFLARLADSSYVDKFVLKGGMLLASKKIRSSTQDADVLLRGLTLEEAVLRSIIGEILETDLEDGVEFDTGSITSKEVREGAAYTGLRFGVKASVGGAQLRLKIDVSTGDPIDPEWIPIDPMLGGPAFSLRAYAMESVLAEKIETVISWGDANTRMRDFADILLITQRQEFEFDEMHGALDSTAQHRGTSLVQIDEALSEFATLHQVDWERYLVEAQLDESLPQNLSKVVEEIAHFVDPLVTQPQGIQSWNPAARRWQ
ncbi:MAG: nucleotidyl transferase AbiEii/AbiGii toxin family protein [Solirubrobacterales bacterium]|nr:nucleotidyl transferase AbiEii/AbiGii toxin family protein [Solirubrobacterales bacterium]